LETWFGPNDRAHLEARRAERARRRLPRHIEDAGIKNYAETPGNRRARMLRRDLDELTEFLTFTLWESLDAIKAFAGHDYETALF
jgi:heme-degrading monooxygenase HmoA